MLLRLNSLSAETRWLCYSAAGICNEELPLGITLKPQLINWCFLSELSNCCSKTVVCLGEHVMAHGGIMWEKSLDFKNGSLKRGMVS